MQAVLCSYSPSVFSSEHDHGVPSSSRSLAGNDKHPPYRLMVCHFMCFTFSYFFREYSICFFLIIELFFEIPIKICSDPSLLLQSHLLRITPSESLRQKTSFTKPPSETLPQKTHPRTLPLAPLRTPLPLPPLRTHPVEPTLQKHL